MTVTRSLAVLALLLPAPPLAAARAPVRHVAADWTTVAAATPEGGIRIGNPRAKVQLVEYGSFTCPHCAAFAKEAFPQIRDRYVRTGRLSFEFRAALRDKADLVAAIVARCGGPARFLGTAIDVFAAQPDWEQRAVAYDQAHPADPATQKPEQVLAALADGSGLAALAAKHGTDAARLGRCMNDAALREGLTSAAGDAWNVRQIGATPAFYLDGDKVEGAYGWTALEPYLRAALKN